MTAILGLVGGLLGGSKTSASTSSASPIIGEIQQNPVVTVVPGDTSDVASILQGVAAITQVANSPSGGTLNLLNSNSSNPNGADLGASITTPLGSVSGSFNWQTILLVAGAIAVVVYFIKRKK